MGEPPVQLHDWFAAVATSLLPGDRELAVVFHGRVETADGLDTRPTALQLVKRLGADAFRTEWEGQPRTVKLIGPLARERAVAGGIDDVAIATFKDGISPHFEFFLHAAREQRPIKVNLRAAFPPPSKQLASMPSPQPTDTSRQSTSPRRSAFLDLSGVHDEQLAGAPGSMHELAEGLRRARQLRRPVGTQGRSSSTVEERPKLQTDRDAGWARRTVASAADGLESGPSEREEAQMTMPIAKDYAEALAAVSSRPDALSELPPTTANADSGNLVQQGDSTERGATQNMEEVQASDRTGTSPSEEGSISLIRIDCTPKTRKQALAATVVRFFAASHASRRPPPSLQSRVPSAAEASTPAEPVVKSSPRRSALRISRFQANVTANLQRSDPPRASSEAPMEPPKEAIQEDGGDVRLEAQAEPLSEEPMDVDSIPSVADTTSRTAAIEAARDELAAGDLTNTAPPTTAAGETSGQREQTVVEVDLSPPATAEQPSASPRDQTEKIVCGVSPASDVSTSALKPTTSLAVAFAEVEPSSDRHSSVEPAFRSSQGFSSMYGESEPEDDDDDVGKAAEEISAFIARDLASSIVDEEEDAERANAIVERPLGNANLIAMQPVTEASTDAAPATLAANIDDAADATDARDRTETSPPLISAAAAADSNDLGAVPVPVETNKAAISADVAPLEAETEEEPIGAQAEPSAAPPGNEQERTHSLREPPPPQLPASNLSIAMPTADDAGPRLPTPPLSPQPPEFPAPAEDYYAPEESKDAYFMHEEELSQTSVQRHVADDVADVASSAANEVLQEQPRPLDSRGSSAGGVSSPQRVQGPQLFRDDSIDPYADITDEGALAALAALAALRSSPASTPDANGSRGSSVDVFGQKRYLHKSGSASQPVSSARARTTSAGGKEVCQLEAAHPASDGPRNGHESATKKRKRKASPNFTLEFFTSKSPRKRAPPTQPPLEPAQPVASTSRVTLEDLAERTLSNGAERVQSRNSKQATRATADFEQDSLREPTPRSNAVEAADDLDYNSDSDDPLSAPIRPARLSTSAKRPGRSAKPGRSRRVMSEERDSNEEEESQIVEQALLPNPVRPRHSPTAAKGASQPLNGSVQQRNGHHPARRPPIPHQDLPKPPRKPSLAGKIRPEALPASSQAALARPRASLQTRPPLGDATRHARPAAHAAPPSSAPRPSGVGDYACGTVRRKRPRPQSEEASDSEAERAPPTVPTQRPLQVRDRPLAQAKPAAHGQARRPTYEEAGPYVQTSPPPVISYTERARSFSRGSIDIEEAGDDGPLHAGEESGNDSEQAPTPARPPPTQPKLTKKRKKRKSIVMPRSKSRKRPSTTTSKPTKARSPSPELTASPEQAPRSSATKAGQQRRRAEPGGRGSKKARQAYDHAEWDEDESD